MYKLGGLELWDFRIDEVKIYNKEDFINVSQSDICVHRRDVELQICRSNRDSEGAYFAGYCDVCKCESEFLLDWLYSDNVIMNFRERLVCKRCGLNNRQRFMGSYLRRRISGNATIYSYEQVTSFYKSLRVHFPGCLVIGSEYLGPNKKSGEECDGIRHEDAMNLSFQNESLDAIVSNDVYEHVPDIQASMMESFRVLRPGGLLFISIPFHSDSEHTTVRASLENGVINHTLPPTYHGNPISEEGSLVFYDYGWDFLTKLKEVGFRDAFMLGYYCMSRGYIGEGLQHIFVAEK